MKLLFADDEKNLREILAEELTHLGHVVTVCANGLEAIEAIRKESFDVLLVDLDMPGAGGLEVIDQAKELNSDADTVILTGKGSMETAVEAIRQGVSDYLTKPYKIIDLELLLKRIEEKRKLRQECYLMKKQIQHFEGERKLIGDSPAMRQVQHLIDKIAATDSTVVILGETGTGKELVARAVHDRSPRHKKPFVAVNCGALPETLIESELFGHRKGSFTGADSNRTGLLEVADGGTLFLDEIGELPKGVQSKMLRFLECGEVRRIGENSSTICNVRVVCATLRDLETMVQSGDFREDLWFRINTFEIHLPSLEQRKEDIPELIVYLAKRFQPSLEIRDAKQLFTEKAFQRLLDYDWPGNIRQLANTIEHAMILSEQIPIDVDALPHTLRPKSTSSEKFDINSSKQEQGSGKKSIRPTINKNADDSSIIIPAIQAKNLPEIHSVTETASQSLTLREMEMEAINNALQRNDGNKSKAAEELGISLKTLYNKLNQADGKRSA